MSALLVTKHFKGPLLRGDSVLRSVHTRCSCLMQPVRSGRRRCALAQCGRAPGPGWARKRGIRESPRTEARAHAQARPWALAAPCVLTCADDDVELKTKPPISAGSLRLPSASERGQRNVHGVRVRARVFGGCGIRKRVILAYVIADQSSETRTKYLSSALACRAQIGSADGRRGAYGGTAAGRPSRSG